MPCDTMILTTSHDVLILMSSALLHLMRYMEDDSDRAVHQAAQQLDCITRLPGIDRDTEAMIRTLAARCRALGSESVST